MNSTPAPVFDRCRRLDHLVGRRRREDLAGASGIEHAVADQAAMQRLVARAAAGYQRDLARLQIPAADEFVAVAENENVGMRRNEAVEAFGQHGCRLN